MNFQKRDEIPARSFAEKLDLLAEVAVKVGLGLKAGQELVMTAPLEALPLVRRITEHAYKAGGSLVTALLSDEEATLMRFEHGQADTFDKASGWLFEGMANAFKSGAARLLRSLLYDTQSCDPLTFVAVPVLLAAVSLCACYLPARRAATVDPVVALRAD